MPRPTGSSRNTCCVSTGWTRPWPPRARPRPSGLTSYEYWHFLGVLLRRTRDFKAAAEAQQRAVDLNPGHAASKHELAQVLIKQADAEHQRIARQA